MLADETPAAGMAGFRGLCEAREEAKLLEKHAEEALSRKRAKI